MPPKELFYDSWNNLPHLALIAAGTGHKIPLKCQKLSKFSHGKLDISKLCTLFSMALPVMEFKSRETKLERFLPKNQHTQRKFLDFEN